ncbi:MAG TPA: acyl-CoA dehydratase activase [Candidatus Hydrogenedentes bacterium]|nr:acyl-CoA dehydratase activase [Candidatus Hydrogenedentota bacterium]HPG67613.1 acyl-CoA dehydratase activase [Candidatus Hydrogenedentota bacterium]
MLHAGIDVGSANTKAVLVDDEAVLKGRAIMPSGVGLVASARQALADAIKEAGSTPENVATIIGTGYGREIVPNKTKAITEITCHARGAVALFADTRFVIDIGGQDSKAIALGPNGAVTGFEMNDKCAAGTGRFLEVMARALEVGLDRMAEAALSAKRPATISSTCTVFAESEVVSLLAQGEEPAAILAGLCQAVAERVHGLAARVGVRREVTMTGGVARNAAVVRAMERILGFDVNVPEDPLIVGALGAALIARDMRLRGNQ